MVLYFNFLRTWCIFDSSVLAGSFSRTVNYFVHNISKHFAVYFDLSITTPPRPLSCFSKMSSLFDESEIIFLCVCSTFMLEYLSHVLRNLVLTFLTF